MKLKCPNCKEWLPQIGNDPLLPGDDVTCGLCLRVWIPQRALTMTLPPPPETKECLG